MIMLGNLLQKVMKDRHLSKKKFPLILIREDGDSGYTWYFQIRPASNYSVNVASYDYHYNEGFLTECAFTGISLKHIPQLLELSKESGVHMTSDLVDLIDMRSRSSQRNTPVPVITYNRVD